MNTRHLYVLSAGLALIGLVIFAYKVWVLHLPLTPDSEQKAWDIEVRFGFEAPGGGPVKAYLFVPQGDSRFVLEDEQFISQGYGLSVRRRDGNRQVTWSIRQAKDRQVLFYRATIRPAIAGEAPAPSKTPELPEVTFTEAERVAADAILTEARQHSADVDSLIGEILKTLQAGQTDHVKALLGNNPKPLQGLEVASRILALAKIPARPVQGVRLQQFTRKAQFLSWLEVYRGRRWVAYQPATGDSNIPTDYLVWWRGGGRLYDLQGASHPRLDIAILEKQESLLRAASWGKKASRPLLYEASLLNLPVGTQAVYKIIMTIPLGVFLLVILRNVVGLKTFGTFMPVLIALAFRETQLLWGITHFTLIITLGLVVRFYLGHLKLLLVPRLASILIGVIIIMAGMSILSNELGMHRGLSVALFPMVIITMTIERMSIVWDERGQAEAIKQGLGSLFAAALAYLVLINPLAEHLLFVFPELILEILAATLLLGRYSGYRLLELGRFKALAGTPGPGRSDGGKQG